MYMARIWKSLELAVYILFLASRGFGEDASPEEEEEDVVSDEEVGPHTKKGLTLFAGSSDEARGTSYKGLYGDSSTFLQDS